MPWLYIRPQRVLSMFLDLTFTSKSSIISCQKKRQMPSGGLNTFKEHETNGKEMTQRCENVKSRTTTHTWPLWHWCLCFLCRNPILFCTNEFQQTTYSICSRHLRLIAAIMWQTVPAVMESIVTKISLEEELVWWESRWRWGDGVRWTSRKNYSRVAKEQLYF